LKTKNDSLSRPFQIHSSRALRRGHLPLPRNLQPLNLLSKQLLKLSLLEYLRILNSLALIPLLSCTSMHMHASEAFVAFRQTVDHPTWPIATYPHQRVSMRVWCESVDEALEGLEPQRSQMHPLLPLRPRVPCLRDGGPGSNRQTGQE
jgi:hypothetical protein